MQESHKEWLNRVALELGIDHQDILEAAMLFIEDSREKLKILSKDLNENKKSAMHAAHTIKGSAANLGFKSISSKAQQMENFLRQNKPVDNLVNELREEIKRLADYLKN